MKTNFKQRLANALEEDRDAGLSRHIGSLPWGTIDFGANDYLGLASHLQALEAARDALRFAPVGARAARLLSGNHLWHEALEREIASLKDTENALVFSSGYAAACGMLPLLAGPEDYIVLDRSAHACLIDGAKLSRAKLRAFEHNDIESLECVIKWIRERFPSAGIWIVVESVYSMDGDWAPLNELCDLKERYGAWLMVDEAHATGVFGPQGAGLCQECGVGGRVEVQMGTLSKAFGAMGGFVAGPSALIQLAINRARTFLFSTGISPVVAAVATKAIRLSRSKQGDRLRTELRHRMSEMNSGLSFPSKSRSPIVPIVMGSAQKAVEVSSALLKKGLYVPAIRHPTVPKGTERLRISLSALHKPEDIRLLAACLRETMDTF